VVTRTTAQAGLDVHAMGDVHRGGGT